MRREKKPSAYSQRLGTSNIADFAAEKSARSYRVERTEECGKQVLKLYVPYETAPGGEKSIDISFLLDFPLLYEPFSEAIATKAKHDASPLVTVAGKCLQLKNGLIAYLGVAVPNAALPDITTEVFERFIVWLRRAENGKEKYKKISKQHFQSTASSVLQYLQNSDRWKGQLSSELTLRTNYWRGEVDDRKQVQIISEETYREIYIACKKEIITTMAKVRSQRASMEAMFEHPAALQGDVFPAHAYHPSGTWKPKVWAENPYKDLGVCLAALRHRVPGVILSISELEKMQDKMLLRVIQDKKPFGSIPQLHYCFYPYVRDLVPFVLMLAIHLDYNPETLLNSLLQDFIIRKNEVGSRELVVSAANLSYGGGRRSLDGRDEFEDAAMRSDNDFELIAKAKKGRAGNKAQLQIRPATADPDNPAYIVDFLKEWTSFIRPVASPVVRERLFIYVTEQVNRAIRTFSGHTTAGSDRSWRNALHRFYNDHGLPPTALNRFRTTGLDITDTLFDGDIRAKQAAGNHASPDTTYRLYSSDAQKQRGDEFLAQVLQLRTRWRESTGTVDPRNKPSGADFGAATPGWTCVDPFAGPFAPNKLCSSYGSCPVCPNASIALNDEYACAQAWNLLAAVDDAAGDIAPAAWLRRWAPVKTKLVEFWLPSFSHQIEAKARAIKLAKLPPLE
ncbi:hypothetical protein [Massilia sp. KIM]|uniref:hypothetical protein n=1 Tax=Massilia sp. KIM TaxID=1955422 RepID=UPI00117DA33F|nr:hypothetical protein [Massilia sp. KIM]